VALPSTKVGGSPLSSAHSVGVKMMGIDAPAEACRLSCD
jgi:hypothetical protein